MKKKSVFVIVTICMAALLALTFAACGNSGGGSGSGGGNEQQNDIYSQLNTMLQNVSFPVTLTSKTIEDDIEFDGTYTIIENEGTYSISYSYEELSTFSVNDGVIVAPESFKTTQTGSMKVKDGKVIERNGAEANISVTALDVQGITLSQSALTDVRTENGTFSATVSSLQTVTGMTTAVTSASISITYNDTKITRLVLTYATSSYSTTITYAFS